LHSPIYGSTKKTHTITAREVADVTAQVKTKSLMTMPNSPAMVSFIYCRYKL